MLTSLYSKNDRRLFNQELETILAECRKIPCIIDVLIPRVAFLEHLFRRIQSAAAQFRKVKAELHTLQKLAGLNFECPTEPTQLKRLIYRTAGKWRKENEATIVRTPHERINWRSLIRRSIWRMPPFSPYDPNDSKEKGFRDALIHETVLDIFRRSPNELLFLVTGDALLAKAVKEAAGSNSTLHHFSDISTFGNYVKLNNEHISKFLADTLTSRAPLAFYDPSTNTGLYVEQELAKHAKFDLSKWFYHISPPSEDEAPEDIYGLGLGIGYSMAIASDIGVTVGSTNFDRLDSASRYHWFTEIRLAALMVFNNNPEIPYLVTCLANWSCQFKEDGTPYDARFDGFEDGCLTKPLDDTEENAKAYGLPTRIQRLIANLK